MLRLDLSWVPIRIVGPGDNLFDETEIFFKLLAQYGGDRKLLVESFVRRHGLTKRDLCNGYIPTDFYREVAQKEGITLDGNLSGFCFTDARDKTTIYFCAIKDVIAMAKKYAEKEGERERVFAGEEDAQQHLRWLCEQYVLHELGHVLYARVGTWRKKLWSAYLALCPAVQEKIRQVQSDKFLPESEIPNEAFAEYCEELLSRGREKSRIGKAGPVARVLMRGMLRSLRQGVCAKTITEVKG